jgi:hypothetical protein
MESVPIWTLSGLFLFGIPTFLSEALIAVVLSLATARIKIATAVTLLALAGLTLAQLAIGFILGPTLGAI